jgi:hypothetical protein
VIGVGFALAAVVRGVSVVVDRSWEPYNLAGIVFEAVGFYSVQNARASARPFFTWTVPVRVGQFVFFVVLVSSCSRASGRGWKGVFGWVKQKIVCCTVFL